MKTRSVQTGAQSFPIQTEYQDDKQEKKQKLVRNEFLDRGGNKFGIPLVKKQNIDLTKIEPWSFVKTKLEDEENKHKTIHFFTYDWLFETVFDKPEKAFEKLDQYYAVMGPEFSTYKDMPYAVQLWSVFKSRWCCAFWQKHGLKVIPTIAWGTPDSHEFCFEGVEQGSTVAVSTYYSQDNKKGFMEGYEKMLEKIKPSAILCYGVPFREMRGNVIELSPYDHKALIKQLGQDEYVRRYMAGDLYPSN